MGGHTDERFTYFTFIAYYMGSYRRYSSGSVSYITYDSCYSIHKKQ